jgi:hypothetical protein
VSLAPGIYGPAGTPLTQLTGGGSLQVTAQILPGDFNGNNVVDAADYVLWRDSFGTFNILANDPYFGTEIDQDQYDVWRSHFGNTSPGSGTGSSQSGSVPEPTAALLAIVASALAFAGGRRRLG